MATISDPSVFRDVKDIDISNYDHYMVAFSGGKDSTACVLWLLEQGIEKSQIELWHHLIDGACDNFFDWPITGSYVDSLAKALGLSLYFSFRIGGYRAELLKENKRSNDIIYETPKGFQIYQVQKAKIATRRKFPQRAKANNPTRWCTGQLKTDIANIALGHQFRLRNKKTLFITGERAEESANRAKYQIFEFHKKDLRFGKKFTRLIDSIRPVHKWSTKQIWDIIEKYKINPHPCYYLGYARCSCAACIFGSKEQFSTLKVACPEKFSTIANYEKEFETSIIFDGKKKIFLEDYVKGVKPYSTNQYYINLVNSREFNEPIFLDKWVKPLGATGDLRGPC